MAKFISYLQTKSSEQPIRAIATVAVLLRCFFSLRYYTKHGQGLKSAVKGLSLTSSIKIEALGLRYEVNSV